MPEMEPEAVTQLDTEKLGLLNLKIIGAECGLSFYAIYLLKLIATIPVLC